MKPEPTSPRAREELEMQVLQHHSGELPPHQQAGLKAAIAKDPKLAAYAEFVGQTLALAAKSPRDFAGAAIALSESSPPDFVAAAIATAAPPVRKKIIPFSPVWKMAAAAAILLAGLFLAITRPRTNTKESPPLADLSPTSSPRQTQLLTARIDALAAEITQATARLSRGRYQRPTAL